VSGGRRRGLGRGLDALIAEAPAPEAVVRTVPLDRLHPNRFQPRSRFDDAGLDELAESIKSQGVIQPLVVAARPDGDFTIVAGERRWRAAQRAGLAAVPAVVRDVGGDRDLLEVALVENLQRADLNPVEEAEAYQTLREKFGLAQEEVAARVGKARATVANALRLLKLPREVADLLRDGRLTAGQARPLLAVEGEEEQVRLARRAVRDGLTARALERIAAGGRPRPRGERPRPVEVHTAAAEESLTRRLQTRVEIRRRRSGGAIAIHFHSEEELMRLYDLLMTAGERR
jgi:ParB family chromosome partitioning protein